jgi:hypothetical protein
LSILRNSKYEKKQRFGKVDPLLSSGEERDTYSVGSLRRANINQPITPMQAYCKDLPMK